MTALSATRSVATDPPTPPPATQSAGLLAKKEPEDTTNALASTTTPLSTLCQTHTLERVLLSEREPTNERFSALLSDRATGSGAPLDGRLLPLLRALAARYPGARIELVSGYRSPKLNEMLRKKGHNVASHSQHSLGNAVDFRIVPDGATKGVDPRVLEKLIRKLGWRGGVGVYTRSHDWFVHADVGRNRHWKG
jgi:uncharacterized protein YcbK (DUF882 family)